MRLVLDWDGTVTVRDSLWRRGALRTSRSRPSTTLLQRFPEPHDFEVSTLGLRKAAEVLYGLDVHELGRL